MNDLYLLAINLTRRCNLACAHCYLDADTLANGSADELGSAEVCALLDEVASRGRETMVVLTGGEPLVRRDLESIIAHGAALGLAMVVGSNGIMLTRRRARALKQAGALGVGISLDSLDADHHDAFRGLKGAWRRTMAGIEACRSEALSFQLHFSVTDTTAHELPAMIDFARSSGARILNVFFLVCTGRGKSLSDISPARYEQVLRDLVSEQSRQSELIIRARCAPHFKRIAFDRDPRSLLNRISGSEGDGCIAGSHYCRVTPEGNVTACPYIEDVLGNVRERAFLDIWEHAPDLQRLRQPVLEGKCGECEYQRLCGGCRARPRARGEDLMAADPICAYTPRGGAVLVPLPERGNDRVRWSQEAQNRLSRVPAFVRRLVRTRAEAYAAELGESVVTTSHLSALTARRFGAAHAGARPQGTEHTHD